MAAVWGLGYDPGQYTADDARMAQVIGPNAAYYLEEFHKAEANLPTQFNIAAFLLGPYFVIYRKCSDIFRKRFMFPWIISAVCAFIPYVNIILGAACGILMQVECILCGLRFNGEYMVECQNRLASSNRKKWGALARVFLFIVVAAAVWTLAVIVQTAIIAHKSF